MLDWKWLVIAIGAFWYFFMYRQGVRKEETSLKNENPMAVGVRPVPPVGRAPARGDTPSTNMYNPMSSSVGRTTFNPNSPADARTYSRGKNRGLAPSNSAVPVTADPAKTSTIPGTVIPQKGN